jgi:hypothetical protein
VAIMDINVSCEECGDALELIREYSDRSGIQVTVKPCGCAVEERGMDGAIEILKALSNAQGFASVGIAWDSHCGAPQFKIWASRERDGLVFERDGLTQGQFVAAIAALCENNGDMVK